MTTTTPATERYLVRTTTTDDLDAVAKLAACLVREHYAWDPKRFIFVENVEAGYKRFLAGECANKSSVVITAVDRASGQVVGYAYGRLEPKNWVELREACGMLHDIYVDATVRRSGVARALVEDMVARLAKLGAPRVLLHTASQNVAGQALFAKSGFRPTMIEMTRECE